MKNENEALRRAIFSHQIRAEAILHKTDFMLRGFVTRQQFEKARLDQINIAGGPKTVGHGETVGELAAIERYMPELELIRSMIIDIVAGQAETDERINTVLEEETRKHDEYRAQFTNDFDPFTPTESAEE